MRTSWAAAGSALWFALAPGGVAGLGPWLVTGWAPGTDVPVAVRSAGWVLVFAGAALIVPAFVRFVREGRGTPAPVAPTSQLVVGGPYRFVRNPMYLAVLAAIVGQALVLGRTELLWYAAVVALVSVGFVHGYEEPTLRRAHGQDYADYCAAVPRWVPRPVDRRGRRNPAP